MGEARAESRDANLVSAVGRVLEEFGVTGALMSLGIIAAYGWSAYVMIALDRSRQAGRFCQLLTRA